MPRPIDIDLRVRLKATVPKYTAVEVHRMFSAPSSFYIDRYGLERGKCAWLTSTTLGANDDSLSAVAYLTEAAHRPEPRIRYECIWRERHGGRRHAVAVEPPWTGKLIVGDRGKPSRAIYLQQVPRLVRQQGLRAAPGRVLVMGDMDRANLGFLAALAGDDVLMADLAAGDPHQAVADALGVERQVGKVANNALCGLAGPEGLRFALGEKGSAIGLDHATDLVRSWRARYAKSAALQDGFTQRVGYIAATNQGLCVRAPDGRRFTFDRAQVRGVVLKNGRSHGPKSIWSSLLRSMEGCALDFALNGLRKLRRHTDLTLVLPMFDGGVWSVPEEHAEEAVESVREALVAGLSAVGVTGTATAWSSTYWTEAPKETP